MKRTDGPWRTFLYRFAGVILVLIVLVTAGTLAFWLIEGWSPADSAWMTIITIKHSGEDELRRSRVSPGCC